MVSLFGLDSMVHIPILETYLFSHIFVNYVYDVGHKEGKAAMQLKKLGKIKLLVLWNCQPKQDREQQAQESKRERKHRA